MMNTSIFKTLSTNLVACYLAEHLPMAIVCPTCKYNPYEKPAVFCDFCNFFKVYNFSNIDRHIILTQDA